jgi:NADH:ubiquinone oxidoreductase subunit F (NADH-binding)
MRVPNLRPGEIIILQCAPCRSGVTWSKAALKKAVGPWADLHQIDLHERLRCQGCGKSPSTA